jgi:hypothetical protein
MSMIMIIIRFLFCVCITGGALTGAPVFGSGLLITGMPILLVDGWNGLVRLVSMFAAGALVIGLVTAVLLG